MKRYLVFAALFIGIASPSAAANLTGAQMKTEIVGKTVFFKTKKGNTGRVRYSKNGKSKLSKTNFDLKKDSGTWRIKGNKFCTTWKVIRKGKERCFSMSKTGAGKYASNDGTVMTVK